MKSSTIFVIFLGRPDLGRLSMDVQLELLNDSGDS